jgi:hypothetical protein
MATQTACIFAIALVALWAAAAVLWFTRGRVIAGWLLTLLPASFCLSYMSELLKGEAALGRGTFGTDERQFLCGLVALVLTVSSAVKWRWRWLFWIVWICNGLVCAVVVYLVFFWKVFS